VLAPPNFSLLLVMACFWLVFLLVSTQFVRPLGALLDQRERRDREAREGFEAAQHAFDEALARCQRELAQAAAEAQKERAGLRAAGEAARRARLEAARSKAQERLAMLDEELRGTVARARVGLRDHTAELASDLASRLVGRTLR